jgi:hypothetical protein
MTSCHGQLALNTAQCLYKNTKSVFVPVIILLPPSRLPQSENNQTNWWRGDKIYLLTFPFNISKYNILFVETPCKFITANFMWCFHKQNIISFNSWEICCTCARFPLKLEDFPEEITRCSWLLYIFECLFNLYNFFARDKEKVKCTLCFQCIEYLVCVWTAIEYYNLDTNKKTFDTLLNLQSCLPIVASLTALQNKYEFVQTERSSMLIQLTYSLYKYGWFKMFSIEFSKLLSIDMIISNIVSIKLWKCCWRLRMQNNYP